MSKQQRLSFSARDIFVNIRSYLAGRFVGSTRDEFFLNEVIKILFCKYEILRRNYSVKPEDISRTYRACFREIVNRYLDIFESTDEIELDAESICYIDDQLNTLDLHNMERDVMGDAYELFMGSAVKGQFGQFFTPKNAADLLVSFVNPTPNEIVLDLTCGACGFLASSAQHISHHYPDTNMHEYVASKLFGIDKDAFLTRLGRIRLASLYETTGHIVCADSLAWNEVALGDEAERFDVILTNPPFGSNISAGSEDTLRKFELAHKYRCRGERYFDSGTLNLSIPPQIVFFEQCLKLLRPGGRLGIVIPESMISSRKYGYVSDYLLDRTTVKAIVGMPENLFKTSGKGGTHTKTCLVYLEKIPPQDRYQHFFAAEARWCGHDSRGRAIPNDDLPTICENFKLYREGKLTDETELGCIANLNGYDGTILTPRSFTCILGVSIEDKRDDYDFYTFGDLIDRGIVQVATGDEVGKLEYGAGDIPFIRTSDIANWRIASDSKHKISEHTYDTLRHKQDVRANDILMVKDGGYLIGTCAMITELDTRIVYQSHIYKFRVMPNDIGLTSHYLLAILSSNYTSAQVEAKTCTLDIINSLGNRYRDILIPIPKDKMKLEAISNDVAMAIAKDIESRKLVTRALEMAELLPVGVSA